MKKLVEKLEWYVPEAYLWGLLFASIVAFVTITSFAGCSKLDAAVLPVKPVKGMPCKIDLSKVKVTGRFSTLCQPTEVSQGIYVQDGKQLISCVDVSSISVTCECSGNSCNVE